MRNFMIPVATLLRIVFYTNHPETRELIAIVTAPRCDDVDVRAGSISFVGAGAGVGELINKDDDGQRARHWI